MAIRLTEEQLLEDIKRCYKQYRLGLKKKNGMSTKFWEGKLDVYEQLYKKAGGDYATLDNAKEKIDELLER